MTYENVFYFVTPADYHVLSRAEYELFTACLHKPQAVNILELILQFYI